VHTVLVVDDDAAVRRALTRFLDLDGFVTAEAENGAAALAYLKNGGPASLILLELHMPLMDGWEFRKYQREDPALAEIPVIVVSGAEAFRLHEIEPVAMFRKPARMSDLLKCVRRVCGRTDLVDPQVHRAAS
jgi:CheY-like chemotaxis protein